MVADAHYHPLLRSEASLRLGEREPEELSRLDT
jgi:hypothetical protein